MNWSYGPVGIHTSCPCGTREKEDDFVRTTLVSKIQLFRLWDGGDSVTYQGRQTFSQKNVKVSDSSHPTYTESLRPLYLSVFLLTTLDTTKLKES